MKQARALPVLVALACVAPSIAATAHARTPRHTCELVAPDLILVDGLLDDWRGTKRTRARGKGDDASFVLRCAYDQERLYLAVNVRDDYVYRDKAPRAKKDDNLALELRAGDHAPLEVVLYPGNGKVSSVRRAGNEPVPADLLIEDTLQRRGWSAELAVPFSRIPGAGKGTPSFAARITYRDADVAARTEDRVSWHGTVEMQAAAELFGSFLQATKLKRADIRLDTLANVDDRPGLERVVAGGTIVGVVGERFGYLMLPVRSPGDVRAVKVADLRGDGTRSILAVFRQRGNGGSRDVLAVWSAAGLRLERVLAVEVRKELAGRVLENRWSLAPKGAARAGSKGKRGAAGQDLVIEVSEADVKGWDKDSYHDVPAPDVTPILTPWSKQTSAVYSFEGNTALGGEPRAAPSGAMRREAKKAKR